MDHKTERRFIKVFTFVVGSALGSALAFMCFYRVEWSLRSGKNPLSLKSGNEIYSRRSLGELRILCVVTLKSNSWNNYDAVRRTYVHRCNRTLFYASSQPRRKKKRKTLRGKGEMIALSDHEDLEPLEIPVFVLNSSTVDSWSFHRLLLRRLWLEQKTVTGFSSRMTKFTSFLKISGA